MVFSGHPTMIGFYIRIVNIHFTIFASYNFDVNVTKYVQNNIFGLREEVMLFEWNKTITIYL